MWSHESFAHHPIKLDQCECFFANVLGDGACGLTDGRLSSNSKRRLSKMDQVFFFDDHFIADASPVDIGTISTVVILEMQLAIFQAQRCVSTADSVETDFQ